jgi:cytochrome c-type biogenesis protein CcmH/NrfF
MDAEAISLLAHGGEMHVYDYVLYLMPVIVVLVIYLVGTWRARRRLATQEKKSRPGRTRPRR